MSNDNSKGRLAILKKDKLLLRLICEKLFTFGELSKGLSDVDSSTGNINCPFHPSEGRGENKSQSAKVYYNEERNIFTIHCFTTKKTYTTFDYIEKVMEEDPLEFVLKNKNTNDILEIIELVEKGYLELHSDMLEKRVSYINKVFESSSYSTARYIEMLYTDNDIEA